MRVRDLTPADLDDIAGWRYDDRWAVYDSDGPLDPELGYWAVVEGSRENERLVGFGCLGDDLGVFCHGQVEELTEDHPDRAAVEAHLTAHYGSSPSSWGPEIYYGRVQPHWMVTYAFAKDTLLAEAAGTEAGR